MMPTPAAPSPEREAIRRYDRPRRLASNQVIVLALMVILSSIIIAFTGYAVTQATGSTYPLDGIFGLCLGLYGHSYYFTSRENLALATGITVAATNVTIVVAAYLWITILSVPLGETVLNLVTFAQFISLAVPIILAGALMTFGVSSAVRKRRVPRRVPAEVKVR